MQSKILVLCALCVVIAVSACRREEAVYEPLKVGGPTTERPAR
jgi:hypothetical protein